MSKSDSSSEEGQKTERKSNRSDDVRFTLEILESQKYFSVEKILGRGTYGDVFMMHDSARDSNVAVKIITSENIAKIELELWPKLRHPNIVPVLEIMTLRPVEVAIFVMPLQRKSLHDLMYDRRFLCRKDSLDILKGWLFQTLSALDYLDVQDLCHLDIKVDNVLISSDQTAKLCDFSFLNYSSKYLERYDLGLPYIYRPPEACQTLGSDISVDGRAYDMWGFGIMAVEIFTHFVLASDIPDCKNWIKEVYPTLFSILQEKEFSNLMTQTFPGYNMSQKEFKLALDFIYSFLILEPDERSVALEASQHQFLNRGMKLVSWTDPIWTQEVYSKSVELPSVKSWKEKSPHLVDGKIDEDENCKEPDESSPTTDDEYLTMSDSDDDTKDSNSINEYMNTLSQKDHSSSESTQMEQSKSNESLIGAKFLDTTSESKSEIDPSQMGDASVIKKDQRNIGLLISKRNFSIFENDVEQNNGKDVNKEYYISRSDSKIVPKGLKKKHGLNKKTRFHQYPIKSKALCLRSEVYTSSGSDKPLKEVAQLAKLLKKLQDKKISRVGYNGKSTFYKVRKNSSIGSNVEKNINSENLPDLFSSSSGYLTSDISKEETDSKSNESSEKFQDGESKKENYTFDNTDMLVEFDEGNNKDGNGDTFLPKFENLIDFDDIYNPSTSSCKLISPLKPAPIISKVDVSDQSVEIDEASHFMVSVNKTLGQLNQINSILQKVLICEKCNSKRQNVKEDNIESGDVAEIRTDSMCLEFRDESKEEVEDNTDDTTHRKTLQNVCRHEIICSDGNLPLDITNSQNINLIINCPVVQKEIHQAETSIDGKPKGSPETCEAQRKLKRGRSWKKWMRTKYQQIERVVKNWPYKVLK